MKQAGNGRELMPQLDSLRAFAVSTVALHHWRTHGFDTRLFQGCICSSS